MGAKLTTETFVKRATEKHNNFYDYSKVFYINGNTDVCIIDPEYGEYWVKPILHLTSGGIHPLRNTTRLLSTEEFIAKAIAIHGNIYDYSKVQYRGNKTKVCIIDPIYGEFWQKPNDHLNGFGNAVRYGNVCGTKETFIKNAREVHGDLYDYSKVVYVNDKTKVCIIDPIHGEFWQKPNAHLNGNGHRARSGHMFKYAYIHMIYDGSTPIAIKYGIETHKGRRVKNQNFKSIFNVTEYICYEFDNVENCMNAENECKRTFKRTLTEREMPDGFSETTSTQHIDDIQNIYKKFGGIRID